MPDRQMEYANTQWLEMMTSGNAGVLKQLIDLLEGQIGELDRLVKRPWDAEVAEQLVQQLHLMRGSTASLGMQMIPETIASLELGVQAPAQPLNEYRPQSEAVLRMLHDALNELKSLL